MRQRERHMPSCAPPDKNEPSAPYSIHTSLEECPRKAKRFSLDSNGSLWHMGRDLRCAMHNKQNRRPHATLSRGSVFNSLHTGHLNSSFISTLSNWSSSWMASFQIGMACTKIYSLFIPGLPYDISFFCRGSPNVL